VPPRKHFIGLDPIAPDRPKKESHSYMISLQSRHAKRPEVGFPIPQRLLQPSMCEIELPPLGWIASLTTSTFLLISTAQAPRWWLRHSASASLTFSVFQKVKLRNDLDGMWWLDCMSLHRVTMVPPCQGTVAVTKKTCSSLSRTPYSG
jgi:hypothetical protein